MQPWAARKPLAAAWLKKKIQSVIRGMLAVNHQSVIIEILVDRS
jgi:hypothetical protein